MAPLPVLPPRLNHLLALARWAVMWERLWPQLVPPLGVAGVFVALALFDVLPFLPPWFHLAIVAGFAATLAGLGVRGWRRLRLPDEAEAARRLERDSQLDHRPLTALSDQLATGAEDPVSQTLWEIHRSRAAATIDRLRLSLPAPGMAARDPLGLRAAVILLLVIALGGGVEGVPRRLGRALLPAITLPGQAGGLEVWVTPPPATGLAPLTLPADGQPVAIPAGSTVLAVLTGGWGGAELSLDGTKTPFIRQPDGSQRLEAAIGAVHRLEVRQFFHAVASWPLTVVADALPSIEFSQPPSTSERGQLRLSVTASDDYGLARLWVEIRRAEHPGEDPLVVPLMLVGTRPRTTQSTSWHDLTAHPWAGRPVLLRPVAEDSAGQIAAGGEISAQLPERSFINPLARLVDQARKDLGEDPKVAPAVAQLMERIAAEPPLFGGRLATALALRLARRMLEEDGFDVGEAQDLLWNIALVIEDGLLPSAERSVDDARAALEQALGEGASAEELRHLINRLEAALQDLVNNMAERMPPEGPVTPQPDSDEVMTTDDLAEMLDAMRGLADAGARDALRRMLEDLAERLSNVQATPPSPADAAMAKTAEQLRLLAERQQQLLDQSFREARRDKGPPTNGASAAQAQAALQHDLEEVLKGLGREPPSGLSEAGPPMAGAAGALARGAWGRAAEFQGEALQHLRQGLNESMRRLGAGQGQRDPLGRRIGDDGATRLPEKAEIQRARQILDELRRRAGDHQRPEPERDYLRRLLKQF